MQCLFVFIFRFRVVHDTAPHGKNEAIVGDGGRADGDGQIHGVVEADVADGTGIDVTAMRLQFVDDLHGPYLGTAGNGSPWKGGSDQIHGMPALGQQSLHHGNQVIDIPVCLQTLVLGHDHRPPGADLADIVSQQVNDHGEFGVIFGTAGQRGHHLPVPLRCLSPWTGAFDWTGFHPIAAAKQKPFRRGGDDLMIAGIDIGEKRGGIQAVQGLKKTVSVTPKSNFEPLGQVHLVNVTGGNVFPDPLH